MERNFAQIAFWIYALLLVRTAHRALCLLLSKKIGKRALLRNTRGLYHAATFDQVKPKLPPALWYTNIVAVSLLFAGAVFHLVLGWFDVLAVVGKILNSLMLLAAAFLAVAGSLLANVLRYGEMFFLYKKNEDQDSIQAFSSSVLDAVLYVVLPLLMIVCNFTTL